MYKRKLHYFDHPPTNSRPLIKERCSHHINQPFYQIVLVSEKHRDDTRHDQAHHADAHKITLSTCPKRSDRES